MNEKTLEQIQTELRKKGTLISIENLKGVIEWAKSSEKKNLREKGKN